LLKLLLYLLSEGEVVVMTTIDDYYLPLTSLKRVLIGTIFIEDEGNYDDMMTTIIRGIMASGMHEDALKWGYVQGSGLICIYKQVPMLDIYGHLSSQ